VEDTVHALHGPGAGGGVDDVPLDELDLRPRTNGPGIVGLEVPQAAAREVIEDPHAVAPGDERIHKMGADEAGTAGNQSEGHGSGWAVESALAGRPTGVQQGVQQGVRQGEGERGVPESAREARGGRKVLRRGARPSTVAE